MQSSLPLKIPGDQPVKYILNDEKIKGKETPIKKLYSHLIDIKNKIINDDNNNKKEKYKKNILIYEGNKLSYN